MEQQRIALNDEVVEQFELCIDLEEAARLLHISRGDLLRLVESGEVPARKLRHGKQFCWKFKRSELEPSGSAVSDCEDHVDRELPIQ
jgi:excisionase family DNA binding protein